MSVQWRNSIGQFAVFEPKVKLRKIIVSGKRFISETNLISRSKLQPGFTGIILTNAAGRRVKIEHNQIYEHGFVYSDGVKIFRLRTADVITKKQIDDIRKYLANIHNRESIEDFIEDELYPDLYKESVSGSNFT